MKQILPRPISLKSIPRSPLIIFPDNAARGALRWPDAKSLQQKVAIDERNLRDPEQMAIYLRGKAEWNTKEFTRELYDSLGALIIAATDQSGPGRAGPARSDEALRLSHELQQSLNIAVDLKRQVANALGLREFDSVGLFGAIRWQLAHACLNGGLRCAWRGSQEPPLNSDVAISLFGFVKEALELISVNKSSAAVLYAFVKPSTLTLQFTYNRHKENIDGAPAVEHLRRSIELLGGRFTFISSSSGGSSLRAEIPLGGPHSMT
jgi:glucose-6-phosphate-specific signal transduction histidine kinase